MIYRRLTVGIGIPVWQHIGQSATATSIYYRNMTSDVKAPPPKKKKIDMEYSILGMR